MSHELDELDEQIERVWQAAGRLPFEEARSLYATMREHNPHLPPEGKVYIGDGDVVDLHLSRFPRSVTLQIRIDTPWMPEP